MYFQKPSRMRWQYEIPPEQKKEMVSDGRLVWMYMPPDGLVMVYKLDQVLRSDLVMRFFSGIGQFQKDFTVSWKRPPQEGDSFVIDLFPKKEQPELKRLTLTINPKTYLVEKLDFANALGEETRFAFSQMKLDVSWAPISSALRRRRESRWSGRPRGLNLDGWLKNHAGEFDQAPRCKQAPGVEYDSLKPLKYILMVNHGIYRAAKRGAAVAGTAPGHYAGPQLPAGSDPGCGRFCGRLPGVVHDRGQDRRRSHRLLRGPLHGGDRGHSLPRQDRAPAPEGRGLLPGRVRHGDKLKARKEELPGVPVVTYVNSTAAVKAESDICCTSANAVRVVNSLTASRVLMVPDQNLALYVARHTPKEIITGRAGATSMTASAPRRSRHAGRPTPRRSLSPIPNAAPRSWTWPMAIRSTSGMLQYVRESAAQEFIIGTEKGILHRMRKENPARSFTPPPAASFAGP